MTLRTWCRRLLYGALASTLLVALPMPAANAADGQDDYSKEWETARNTGYKFGTPDSWGPLDGQGNNPSGFHLNWNATFHTSNNRLTDVQSGDQGYHWAVAGPKEYGWRRIYNYTISGTDYEGWEGYDGFPTGRPAYNENAQYYYMLDDLAMACEKPGGGQTGYEGYCTLETERLYGYNEVLGRYSGNATDYRTRYWGAINTNTRWTIYLAKANGALSWPGGPWWAQERRNFGQVATVGELRKFIKNEITTGEGSEIYRYNLGRALLYLDYIYGTGNDDHAIEMLSIPSNWFYACGTPRLNPDGTIYRDFYGNIEMVAYEPTTYADPTAKDSSTRAMSCPPHEGDGHWEYSYESEISNTPGNNEVISAPYAVWTSIEDDSPSGVGRTPFIEQQEYRLTPFGEKVQEFCAVRAEGCAGNTVFTDAESDELRAAAAASQNATGPLLDLTTTNKKSLAEGRLLLVSKRSQFATITQRSGGDRYMRRWVATKSYYDDSGTLVSQETTRGQWEYAGDPSMDLSGSESTFDLGSTRYDRGYQILVNHCNGAAFTQEAGARSIDDRPLGDDSFTGRYLAGSAVSASFTDPMNRPWGLEGETATVGFYDKVCSFEGTRTDPATETPTSEPVPAYTRTFRDGEFTLLPTAYYTPTSQGWVNYTGNGPVGFTATRWEEGTPVPGQFWVAGRDCQTGQFSDGLFSETHQEQAPTLRQWTLNNYSSQTVAIGAGCYKEIFTKAVWASDRRQPQVLTVKWDFKPEVATVVPSTQIGFTASEDSSYEKETVGAPVRGQVASSAEPGRTSVPAHRPDYVDHTGSGTTNALDVPVPYGTDLDAGDLWRTSPDSFDYHYYALEVVRAVGG